MRAASLAAVAILALPALIAGQAPKQIPAPPDVARAPQDAAVTKSGLATKVLKAGTGTTHPTVDDIVTVQFTDWKSDGKTLDTTADDGKPRTFPLKYVMPGWAEGVEMMVAGESRRLWIPQSLGCKGENCPVKGPLVCDVELISFMPSPEPPPPDVAAPPADAQKTASGLAYKVLKAGDGVRHPSPSSIVTVNYSGWQTNGVLFDSSYLHGEPAQFQLNQVIKGWTEGVALMVEGEKTRFWIPDDLAYKGQPTRPQGTLVFDIELIKIQ
jgi:peptidylprolyl isomerase